MIDAHPAAVNHVLSGLVDGHSSLSDRVVFVDCVVVWKVLERCNNWKEVLSNAWGRSQRRLAVVFEGRLAKSTSPLPGSVSERPLFQLGYEDVVSVFAGRWRHEHVVKDGTWMILVDKWAAPHPRHRKMVPCFTDPHDFATPVPQPF